MSKGVSAIFADLSPSKPSQPSQPYFPFMSFQYEMYIIPAFPRYADYKIPISFPYRYGNHKDRYGIVMIKKLRVFCGWILVLLLIFAVF